ncbi:hypothetical protein C8J57DRAFT_1231413 [Mycena rebaudengoi]|nr:hypothetical protein C8J57DRAFT_1231413 [Mycena rebaudengoi]
MESHDFEANTKAEKGKKIAPSTDFAHSAIRVGVSKAAAASQIQIQVVTLQATDTKTQNFQKKCQCTSAYSRLDSVSGRLAERSVGFGIHSWLHNASTAAVSRFGLYQLRRHAILQITRLYREWDADACFKVEPMQRKSSARRVRSDCSPPPPPPADSNKIRTLHQFVLVPTCPEPKIRPAKIQNPVSGPYCLSRRQGWDIPGPNGFNWGRNSRACTLQYDTLQEGILGSRRGTETQIVTASAT